MFLSRRRPLAGVIGALAVTVVAVSGCAAGQDAQTVEQTSVVDGTAFQAGLVDLRDVGLAPPTGTSFPKGSTAFLEGLIVNKATAEDRLVSVSSPVASSVAFYPDQTSALLGAAPTSSETPSDTASPSASGSRSESGSPSSSTSPTDTGSATRSSSASGSTGSALTEVPLPSNQAVQFGYQTDQLAIVFVGLTQELFPAQTIQVTFTFASGGTVTSNVQVKLPVDTTVDAPTLDTSPSE